MENKTNVSTLEIARRAGCNQSTVSRALRNDPRIPSSTRQRIKRLATRMGYRPNALVAALMAHIKINRRAPCQSTLGWINHYPPNDRELKEACQLFEKAAKERANKLGYNMESFWLNEPGMSVKRLVQILYTRNIRGLVFAPYTFANERWGREFDWEHLAAVVIGRTPLYPPIHRMDWDISYNTDLIIKRLPELGYRRIGFTISNRIEEWTCNQYGAQFWLHFHSTRLLDIVPCFFHPDFGPESEKKFGQWLEKYKPDALICGSVMFKAWLAKLGLSVPKDIGLAKIDVSTDPETHDWSGIDRHIKDNSITAVDLVVAQMQNNEFGIPPFQKLVLVRGSWVDGKTLRQNPDPA